MTPTPRPAARRAPARFGDFAHRPNGAKGCSHGCSIAALSDAQPVGEDAPPSPSMDLSRPGGAEESPAAHVLRSAHAPRRPSGAVFPCADLPTGCGGEAPPPPVATPRGPSGAGRLGELNVSGSLPSWTFEQFSGISGQLTPTPPALRRASADLPRHATRRLSHATDESSRPPDHPSRRPTVSAALTDRLSRRPGGPAGLTTHPSRPPSRLSGRPSHPSGRPTRPDGRASESHGATMPRRGGPVLVPARGGAAHVP